MINNIKALVAQFQMETKSNNVLEFVVWLDNRMELIKQLPKKKKEKEEDNKMFG